MNISCHLRKECDHCPVFSLSAKEDAYYGDNRVIASSILIDCENRETCKIIREYLKEEQHE